MTTIYDLIKQKIFGSTRACVARPGKIFNVEQCVEGYSRARFEFSWKHACHCSRSKECAIWRWRHLAFAYRSTFSGICNETSFFSLEFLCVAQRGKQGIKIWFFFWQTSSTVCQRLALTFTIARSMFRSMRLSARDGTSSTTHNANVERSAQSNWCCL